MALLVKSRPRVFLKLNGMRPIISEKTLSQLTHIIVGILESLILDFLYLLFLSSVTTVCISNPIRSFRKPCLA